MATASLTDRVSLCQPVVSHDALQCETALGSVESLCAAAEHRVSDGGRSHHAGS